MSVARLNGLWQTRRRDTDKSIKHACTSKSTSRFTIILLSMRSWNLNLQIHPIHWYIDTTWHCNPAHPLNLWTKSSSIITHLHLSSTIINHHQSSSIYNLYRGSFQHSHPPFQIEGVLGFPGVPKGQVPHGATPSAPSFASSSAPRLAPRPPAGCCGGRLPQRWRRGERLHRGPKRCTSAAVPGAPLKRLKSTMRSLKYIEIYWNIKYTYKIYQDLISPFTKRNLWHIDMYNCWGVSALFMSCVYIYIYCILISGLRMLMTDLV